MNPKEINAEKKHPPHSFQIRIAGKVISVASQNPNIINEFHPYLTAPAAPDLEIALSREQLVPEISRMLHTELPSVGSFGEKVAVVYNYDAFESLLICNKVSDFLFDSGIVLFHGAAIAVNNKCFVFIAPSGTGKTTHILNWLRMIPGAFVVNGDKPFIDVVNKIVYGSPWSGKEKMNNNTSVPLAGIISLNRGETNSLEPISFQEILPSLMAQVYIPPDRSPQSLAYSLIGHLKGVPYYKLFCNMEKESALVAYDGLKMHRGRFSVFRTTEP